MKQKDLKIFSNYIIKSLFRILDLTKEVETEKDSEDLTKFIKQIILELNGSLDYFTGIKYGNQLVSVVMKLEGIKTTDDINVRKPTIFSCIGIVDKIKKEME